MKKSIFTLVIILLLVTACADVESTPVPEETAVVQITPTGTDTPTIVPSSTPTFTPTATPTDTPTNTPTPSPTATYTPTPTATAVGGGGHILFQMPRHLYDPEASIGATELFAINSDGTDMHPITDGFNRYVWKGIPSPDRRHTLVLSYSTLPNNLFENPRLDIVGADGSFETVGFLSADVPTAYWLDDGRFVYLSNEGGGTTGAYIASPGTNDKKRLSSPEHNVIKIFPVSRDVEKIYYVKGSISRESAQGGGPAGGVRRINRTGLYWAAIDTPINDLMWDRIEDHYFHNWSLQVDDDTYQIDTNYNIGKILANGKAQVDVNHYGLPEELEEQGSSNMFLLFNELNILEDPPEELLKSSGFPNNCGDGTFSPDEEHIVMSTSLETGPNSWRCPGGDIVLWSFVEESVLFLDGFTDYGAFSDNGQKLIIYDESKYNEESNASVYAIESGTITPLVQLEGNYNYIFSPDGKTILAHYVPTFFEITTPYFPVLLDTKSREAHPLFSADLEDIEDDFFIKILGWLP